MNRIMEIWLGKLEIDGEILKFRAGIFCPLTFMGRTCKNIELPLNTICHYKIGRVFLGCQVLTLYIAEKNFNGDLRIIKLKPMNVTYVDQYALKTLIDLLKNAVSRFKANQHIKRFP